MPFSHQKPPSAAFASIFQRSCKGLGKDMHLRYKGSIVLILAAISLYLIRQSCCIQASTRHLETTSLYWDAGFEVSPSLIRLNSNMLKENGEWRETVTTWRKASPFSKLSGCFLDFCWCRRRFLLSFCWLRGRIFRRDDWLRNILGARWQLRGCFLDFCWLRRRIFQPDSWLSTALSARYWLIGLKHASLWPRHSLLVFRGKRRIPASSPSRGARSHLDWSY